MLIAITDSGTGMSPEIVDKAFEPFFTTKAVGKGSGLGLSQVYGFVRQSGGHVKIYSEPGLGTSVKIYPPRYRGDAARKPSDTVPPADGARHAEVVLVVEDDERVRAISSETLRELGYTVIEGTGGQDAIRIIEGGETPDLLLSSCRKCPAGSLRPYCRR